MHKQHLHQYFYTDKVSPQNMDKILADGWRHFGTYFFRDMRNWHDGQQLKVTPLRINVPSFKLSKSHRKILRQNANTKVIFRDAFIDDEKETMFYKHINRFKNNVPESIYTFLDQNPATVPCHTVECCLFDENNQMYAVSFIDVALESVSSVYAMFDPDYSKYSPGLHTLLCELNYCTENQKKYLYTGYAYREPSAYDYKKKFSAVEEYDWEGNWNQIQEIDEKNIL